MPRLRFVQDAGQYSIYEGPDGEDVYVAHGFPRVYLVEFDPAWMRTQYAALKNSLYGSQFLDWVRQHVIDPDAVDQVQFCEKCRDPEVSDNGHTAEGGGFACDACVEAHYWSCMQCAIYSTDTTTTLNDEEACDRCLELYYTYCTTCNGYRHDQDDCEHDDDDDDDDCESPSQSFWIRNEGNEGDQFLVGSDERVTVGLAAGTLDEEGVTRITAYLNGQRMYSAGYLVAEMDRRWQTKDGNFTKRLSRALYKKNKEKIAPAVLSMVGSIARDHSNSVTVAVEVTRDLNQSASSFGHEGSCWWQSYSSSRCTLKSNGGFGLRSFEGSYVTGRSWVMPLKRLDNGQLTPTFDTVTPAAFIVFNGYGDLEGYAAARIVSHMAGMTYRKVTFRCAPMYVNNDSGYLVAPEDIAADYTDGLLDLTVDVHSNLYHAEKELVHV